jgi:hypothetical protein
MNSPAVSKMRVNVFLSDSTITQSLNDYFTTKIFSIVNEKIVFITKLGLARVLFSEQVMIIILTLRHHPTFLI